MSRSQPSTSATKSSTTVDPASLGKANAAPIHAASVPSSEAKDHPIPPPAKVQTPAPLAAYPPQTPPKLLPPAPGRAQPVPPQRTSAASPVGSCPRLQETAWCLPPQVQTPAPLAASLPQTPLQTPPPAPRRAQPVPPQRTSAATPVGSRLRLQETAWCLPPQVQTPVPAAASPPLPPPAAPRCAQPVPSQRTSAASSVGSRPRLQETSWTLHTLHEAPQPDLALPAVGRLSRSRLEYVSASMEYNDTCSLKLSWLTHPGIQEQSAVDPRQKSKREVQRNSGELLHLLYDEKPTGETLNSPQRKIGYLTSQEVYKYTWEEGGPHPFPTAEQPPGGTAARMEDSGRKRKLKFSEKELEVLTDECCQHHDQLFGRAALSVPETDKRRIWNDIQEKVNTIGLSHRSIEELKKRWYDLRSRTKERVAERLREMRGTGGGPSTVPPPTPMEEHVEQTLEPEAVAGMGELDTSAPRTSTSLPQDIPTSQSVQGAEGSQQAAQESGAATTGPSTNQPLSPPAAPMDIGEIDPAPGPSHSAIQQDPDAPPRRRRRVHVPAVSQEDVGDSSMSATRAALISGQRLQTRQMRVISGAMQRMERNFTTGLAQVHTDFQSLNNHVGDLALSIRQLVTELVSERESARRHERQLIHRLDRMAASIVRLAVNTTGLSRRTVSLQVDLGHFAGDVARGLGQISHPVDMMEARQVARGTADTPQDSEEGSTVSSASATDTRVLRSGSARQGSADTPSTSHAGRPRRRS
ncbi:hypothetical protein NDU88_007711 [Pleurodeles waltl]|uniref:Myb/SANT-like DNA-binding domain-containing protein n=1 Tax=Pleurodeles waltl TaxID=8319 RepID=A0AAV7PQS1_PLEWA|nr:hypothetical protein NDU88_007711 [Pleurodeles waltl]